MRYVVIILAVMLSGLVRAQLPDGLYADFDTTMGGFTCRLDYAEAPLTCANFVGLAEGTQSWIDPEAGTVRSDPFYTGLIFHRVITNFMIQGGCPLGTGTSGPGYAFPDEFSTNLTHHSAGILSMANSGPDSNGSQFFVTLKNTDWLDGVHSVFGEVVDGMGVVSNIGAVATTADRPDVDVVIHQIDILRVGPAAVAFDAANQPLPEVTPANLAISPVESSLQVIAETTNQTMVSIFSSTNLLGWSAFEESYAPVAEGERSFAIPTNIPSRYFRSAEVYYPQAVAVFSDIEGRTLSFTQGTSVLTFSPLAGGTGSCDIAGTAAGLTFWAEWTSEPYVGRVVFQPDGINAFQFLLDQDGICKGYQYGALGWQYIGIWELDIS